VTDAPLTRELPRLAPAAVAAIARAADALPSGRSRLNAVDLVLAILDTDCAGARVVDVLAPGRLGVVIERLRMEQVSVSPGSERFGEVDLPSGTVAALDGSAREVFDRLSGLAGRTADTKDLLRAEATRRTSVVIETLAALGLGGPPDALVPQIEALAARTADDDRSGAQLLVYRPFGPSPVPAAPPDRTRAYEGPIARGAVVEMPPAPAAPTPPATSVAPPASAEPMAPADSRPPAASPAGVPSAATPTATGAPVAGPVGPVIDLLAEARAASGGLRPVYVNPTWIKRILSAVERNPLTVIVTDSPDAADELVAALAQQLAQDTEGLFAYRSVITLEPGALATQLAGTVREGLRRAQGGLLYLPNIVRYFDEARSAGASPDLRRALARRETRVVGTLSERDAGRAWPPTDAPEHELVYLEPAGIEETIAILASRREELARSLSTPALQLAIPDATIDTAARVADRYYRDPPPPAGALRLIQEAATAIKVRAADHMGALHDERVSPTPSIDPDDILLAIERLTGITARLDDQQRLLGIEDFLRQRIVGQDEAVGAVADAIRRARAGLKDPARPIGSFIFMGPSGVGKTELAKALAEFLFDDETAMIRLDMSEYHERHTISRMIGAPPGYVGYDEGGQLTEPVRRKPYQIVLFDEIEKAHPDVHNVLLQIMDDGRLTDSRGRAVDFRNTVVIMTGNVGSEYFRLQGELEHEKIVAAVREEARHAFRPEFLGRVDDFLVFNSLGPAEMRQIVEIQERRLNRKLNEQGLSIRLGEEVKDHLASAGYAPELGARPLNNQIRTLIERPLSRLIIEGRFKPGDGILARLGGDGTVLFEPAPPPDQPAPA
jgi:MoxR-like ATPase